MNCLKVAELASLDATEFGTRQTYLTMSVGPNVFQQEVSDR